MELIHPNFELLMPLKKIKYFKDFKTLKLEKKKHEKVLKDLVSSQVPDYIVSRQNTIHSDKLSY